MSRYEYQRIEYQTVWPINIFVCPSTPYFSCKTIQCTYRHLCSSKTHFLLSWPQLWIWKLVWHCIIHQRSFDIGVIDSRYRWPVCLLYVIKDSEEHSFTFSYRHLLRNNWNIRNMCFNDLICFHDLKCLNFWHNDPRILWDIILFSFSTCHIKSWLRIKY